MRFRTAWIAMALCASGCDSGMNSTDGGPDAGRLVDAGMPGDDAGDRDAGPEGCTIDCDCPQGEVCFDGECITTAEPLFCCEHTGCPSGEACVDTAGVPGVCPECVTHCDCPQGEICTASGLCIAGTTPVYCCDNAGCPLGEACTDASGEEGTCRDCNSHCDCPQGQICTAAGLCLSTGTSLYCCDNAGCPSGLACESRAGAVSTCAVTVTCGNGTIDPGETCDGDCPASCDDLNACTRNVMTGSATTCDAACTFPAITTCSTVADGCCPGCAAGADPDCPAPTCGNGRIDAGETCDPCPSSCDDSNACTRDTFSGSATACTLLCMNNAITSCTGGDGCCPSGCTMTTDTDCGGGGTVIGNPCTTSSMCGAGGSCITNFQGGYCTRDCTSDTECGAGAHCHSEGFCMRNCGSSSQCRTPQYGCFDQDNDTVSECSPLGTGTGTVGDPCTDVGSCGGNMRALCLVNNAYQGYCSLSCASGAICPSGSHCIFDSDGTGVCARNCTDDSMCRSIGYACYDAEAASGGDTECWPAATGTGDVGDPCMNLWDCAGGPDGFCIETLTDGSTAPGGYCSRTCQPIIGICPTGSHCNGSFFMTDAYCVSDCASVLDCRPGYNCYDAFTDPFGTANNECWVP